MSLETVAGFAPRWSAKLRPLLNSGGQPQVPPMSLSPTYHLLAGALTIANRFDKNLFAQIGHSASQATQEHWAIDIKEEHMSLSSALLPEFDHEWSNTRKTLERIPGDKLDWKPHDKSFAMGILGAHIANILKWAVHTVNDDAVDLGAPDAPIQPSKRPASRQEILDAFDKNLAEARAAIVAADDEHLMKPWTLLRGGNTIFTMPRIAILRAVVMNHSIHHRAQLGVYLRLNDVPVPALYGPSADETGIF